MSISATISNTQALPDAAWRELLLRAAAGERVQLDGRFLPAMPDPAIQLRTIGQAGPAGMDEAWTFSSECISRFRSSPCFGEERKMLMDFGTGWGRVARCFLRDIAAEDVVGVDVDADLIAICRDTFRGSSFYHCTPMPP